MRLASICLALFSVAGPLLAQDQGESKTSFLLGVTIPKGSTAKDVVCILCSARIDGRLTGDLILIGGNADITGSVDGDVVAAGGWIRTRGSVGGEAVALGGEIQRQGGGKIAGEIESFPWIHVPGQRSFHPLGVLCLAAAVLLSVAVAAMIWKREKSERLADRATRRWWLGLLVGLAVWYLYLEFVDDLEPTSTVLQIAVLVLLLLLFTGTWFGFYAFVWAIGRRFSQTTGWKIWLTGALIVLVALLAPVLGLLIFCLVFTMGLGAGLLFTWPAWRARGKAPAVPA